MIYIEYILLFYFFRSLDNAIVPQEYIVISYFKVNYKMRTFQLWALVRSRACKISKTLAPVWLL